MAIIMDSAVICMISFILSLCFTHLLGFQQFSSKNGELYSIIIDKERSNVFVGGHNILYNLTQDLEVSREYNACELVNSSRDLCDSDVKVVKENTKRDYLMVCGTVAYGACSALYRNGTYAPFSNSPSRQSTAKYVGSKTSVIAFFGHDYAGDSLLYVAMGYDGRPRDLYPYIISERRIRITNGSYELLYFDINESYRLTDEHLSISYFDFVYGFEDQNHSYFISNQNDSQENIISQSCKATSAGKQYLEAKLTCGGSYCITDAFFLGSDQSKNSGTLYVVFYDNATDTSKLCSYPQDDIHECFRRAILNCHQRLKIPWMVDFDTSCNKQENGSNTCRMDIIMRVDGQLSASPVYQTAGRVAALAARVQTQQGTVVFIGFDDGTLKKVHLRTNRTLLVTGVAKDKKLGIRRGGLLINDRDQRLYVLCKTKVFLFPLDSCGVYNSCRECLEDLDGCGWCLDRSSYRGMCTKSSECNSTTLQTWYKDTCKPQISDVSPKSGPTAGGTLVTITGEFVAESTSSVIVQICNATCDVNINITTTDIIQCSARERQRPEDCSLSVTLLDPIQNSLFSDSANFTYKKPQMTDIRPKFGPHLGGIPMTVTGLNLDVGFTCEVLIGNKQCQFVSRSERDIVCKIPSSGDTTNATRPVDCNLLIDKDRLQLPNFSYVPNPIVRDIEPKTVIQSGGTNITLTGGNLNAVGSVFLEFSYSHYVQRASKGCSFASDGTAMICVTPKTVGSGRIAYHAQIQFVHNHSEEDASWYFRQPPSKLTDLNVTIVADPKVYPDQNEFFYDVETAKDNYTILIKGEDFDLVDRKEISAYIGMDACQIVDVSARNLSCIPNIPTYIGLEWTMNIKILFGENLELSGGRIHYRGKKSNKSLSGQTAMSNIIVAISIVAGIVSMAVIALLVMKRLGVRPFLKRWQPDYLVVEYSSGHSRVQVESSPENALTQNRENDYQEQTFSKGTDGRAPLLSSIDEDLLQTLRGDNLIIERDSLILGELLGQGHFGCVYKGYLQLNGVKEERIVAVKTLHIDGPRDMDINGFLKEALIMKDFHHTNVMELVGICVGLDKMPLVVLPYLRHGDLLTYIRNEKNVPTVKDLMMFCADIADGMCYLAELKFIHRDLAARNCMLDENLTVKVADFGLSRDIYEKEYYSCENKQTKLPVKWMAPESLERGVYTVQSDVWSYGVVVWEVITRGMHPYPGVDNWDMLRYLTDGRRMHKSNYCPDELYQVMLQCWSWEPSERPTFGRLSHLIPDMIQSLIEISNRKGNTSSPETTYVNTGICREHDRGFN